jgi:hypothetical protein
LLPADVLRWERLALPMDELELVFSAPPLKPSVDRLWEPRVVVEPVVCVPELALSTSVLPLRTSGRGRPVDILGMVMGLVAVPEPLVEEASEAADDGAPTDKAGAT